MAYCARKSRRYKYLVGDECSVYVIFINKGPNTYLVQRMKAELGTQRRSV